MKRNTITVHQSILVNKPRELVWDFTQNYANRAQWDSAVIESAVLQTSPGRVVRLKMKGGTSMTFIYKLDDRPHKTSLAAIEVTSPFIESGGGSWAYEEHNGATIWSQTNTIVLKNKFLFAMLLPLYRWVFNFQTRAAMNKAKKIMEQL